jgi:hypothetical protein
VYADVREVAEITYASAELVLETLGTSSFCDPMDGGESGDEKAAETTFRTSMDPMWSTGHGVVGEDQPGRANGSRRHGLDP